MDKRYLKTEIIGFAFVCITGTLSHYIYEWCGYSNIAGALTPINESTWEHLKMIWFPFIIWSIIEYFAVKKPDNYWSGKAIGAVCGCLSTLMFYYTATGIIGKKNMIIDVSSFFIGVSAAFLISCIIIKSKKLSGKLYTNISAAAIIVISCIFCISTYMPPHIGMFKDPKTGTFGI